MGVCCSKGTGIIVEHGTDDSNEYGNGEAEVRDTNDGAVVRTRGSSKHVSMSIKQGKKGINQDAMTVWEVRVLTFCFLLGHFIFFLFSWFGFRR